MTRPFEPKSTGFNILSRTTIECQVSSHPNHGYTPTHSHTSWQSDRNICAAILHR